MSLDNRIVVFLAPSEKLAIPRSTRAEPRTTRQTTRIELTMAAPVATTKSKGDNRPPARAAAESEQAERTIAPTTAPLAGFTGIRRVPAPVNEPIKGYAAGS